MKKIIIFILLLLIPFIVNAKDNCDNNITIKNITLEKLEGMNGTDCSSIEKENDLLYMRVDGGPSSPGCFSLKS